MELPKHFVFFELNYFYLTASATALNGFPADIPIETIASSLADTADVEKVQQQMQQKRAERLSADRNGTIVASDKSSNSQGKHCFKILRTSEGAHKVVNYRVTIDFFENDR